MKKQIIFGLLIILMIFSSMFSLVSARGGAAVRISTIDLNEEGNNYNMKPGRLKFEFDGKLYAIQVRKVNKNM